MFARGDRRLAEVLVRAYNKGARFDSWDECFKRELYSEAFAECGLDPAEYANRRRDLDEPLPWSHVDMLVTEDYLKSEYLKAMKAAATRDCRQGCNGCFGERYADYCKI